MEYGGFNANVIKHINRGFRGTLCFGLALIGIVSVFQTLEIRKSLSQQRLLEASVQDLVVQSHALHYIGDNRPALGQRFLENRGYSSAMEVLNQLDARLAIIEQLEAAEPIKTWHLGLRNELEKLIQTHRENPVHEYKGTPQDTRQSIDQWFSKLYGLNSAMKQLAPAEQNSMVTLERINNALGIALLCMAAGVGLGPAWKQSAFKSRLDKELEKLKSRAMIDPLTGLLNRAGWKKTADHQLQQLTTTGRLAGCIAVLDIDYFKQYNDTFGTDAADKRLKDFANHLLGNFRPGDLIARIGHEEFAVLLLGCKPDEANRIVDRVRQNEFCEVGFSAGICRVVDDQPMDRIMAIADQALYQAKQKGMNQSHVAHGVLAIES